MRVLGIDPGSNVTGYGVVECSSAGGRRGDLTHVAHGNIRLARGTSLAVRLYLLQKVVLEVIDTHRPDIASVEQVFVAASPRSALVLGQARGAALAALGARGVATTEYAATQIKQAVTGLGRASKQQVQTMVRHLLDLDALPQADAADALAAAICHARAGRLKQLGVVERPRRSRRPSARFAVRPAR
jgi:crossover junction endodeoxyribonuclease RuvC